MKSVNDDTHAERHDEEHSLGPLWLITIAMAGFFGIAAFVIMLE